MSKAFFKFFYAPVLKEEGEWNSGKKERKTFNSV